MANRKRDAGRERFWRGVVKRHARSGLSVRAFCRREELAESNFYAWRRTIAQRDRQQGAGVKGEHPLAAAKRSRTPTRRNAAPAFMPLAIHDPAKRDAAAMSRREAAIVVERPDGLRLRFSESIAPDRLAAIVRALEAATPGAEAAP